jgi:hypothetical protein
VGALTLEYSDTLNTSFSWALRSSVNSFATDLATGSTTGAWTPASVNLDSSFDGLSSVEFRFWVGDGGDNAASRYGFFDTVVLNGVTAPVPEPVNLALGAFALGFLGFGVARRYLRS